MKTKQRYNSRDNSITSETQRDHSYWHIFLRLETIENLIGKLGLEGQWIDHLEADRLLDRGTSLKLEGVRFMPQSIYNGKDLLTSVSIPKQAARSIVFIDPTEERMKLEYPGRFNYPNNSFRNFMELSQKVSIFPD